MFLHGLRKRQKILNENITRSIIRTYKILTCDFNDSQLELVVKLCNPTFHANHDGIC